MPDTRPKAMSVFDHYVARCSIAHQKAIRMARDGGSTREVSALTVALIKKLHRLGTLYAEMGGGAVFGTPTAPYSAGEIKSLFPEDD